MIIRWDSFKRVLYKFMKIKPTMATCKNGYILAAGSEVMRFNIISQAQQKTSIALTYCLCSTQRHLDSHCGKQAAGMRTSSDLILQDSFYFLFQLTLLSSRCFLFPRFKDNLLLLLLFLLALQSLILDYDLILLILVCCQIMFINTDCSKLSQNKDLFFTLESSQFFYATQFCS